MRTTYLLSSIEYEFDEITRKFNEFIFYRDQKTLISHFQQVGNRTFELLNTMLIHFKSSNIKITIRDLLTKNKIEIVYARDYDSNHLFCKTKCYKSILSKYLNVHKIINVTTIGDQNHDHLIPQNQNIYQNQIKLLPNPDWKYLCVELKYIKYLIENGHAMIST
eukprot:68730_1